MNQELPLFTPPESVRLSKRTKDQLISLKRKTGISQWNVLCRWGFCLSLANKGTPALQEESTDGGVEMTWRVFAGADADLLWAALVASEPDGDAERARRLVRAHIVRGTQLLAQLVTNQVGDLARLAL